MDDPSTTGAGDAPYYAFVDDYPFRVAYRSASSGHNTVDGSARLDTYDDYVNNSEVPASLLVEMNPLHDPTTAATDADDAEAGAARAGRRRIRFGGHQYQQLPSATRGGRGDTGGLWSRLKRWRTSMSSRERAIYEWTNVDNLDTFFTRVYVYYQGKGANCIMLNRFLSLLMLAFMIAFTTFLVGCINYTSLWESKRLSDALYPSCSSQMSFWLRFFVVSSWIYWAVQLVRFLYDIRKLLEMYNFYTYLLEIPDCDMQTVDWNLIVSRIIRLRETTPAIINARPSLRINAHDICNRILRKENYMVALFNKDLLNLSVPAPIRYLPLMGGQFLTRHVEWNLQLCLFNYVFDESGQVKAAFLRDSQRRVLSEGLRKRFILMGFVNFVCTPFITTYLALMLVFRYFAEYHKYPSAIGSRQYTRFARWKFREFDELPHLFQKRLDRSLEAANLYVDQFPRQSTAHLARFVTFIAGSVALVLFLLTVLDQRLLLDLDITPDRSVAFYLGVFGTVFAVARGAIPDENIVFEPEKTLKEVVTETHYLPSEWRGRLHSDEVRRQFCELFDLKVMLLLREILAVAITPLLLWFSLPACSQQIIDFFREFTVHVDGVGYVCSFALFDFKRHGNIRYGAPSEAVNEHYISKEGKMEKSFINFKANHPDWEPEDMAGSLYLQRLRDDDAQLMSREPTTSGDGRDNPTMLHQRAFSHDTVAESVIFSGAASAVESDPGASTPPNTTPTAATSANLHDGHTATVISNSGAASSGNEPHERTTTFRSPPMPSMHMTTMPIRPTFGDNAGAGKNTGIGGSGGVESTVTDLSAIQSEMLRTSQLRYLQSEMDEEDEDEDEKGLAAEPQPSVHSIGGLVNSNQRPPTSTSSSRSNSRSVTSAPTPLNAAAAFDGMQAANPFSELPTSLHSSRHTEHIPSAHSDLPDSDSEVSVEGNVFALMNEFYDDRAPML